MSELSIARRYAKSLYDLATDEKKVDKIIEDAKTINASLASRDLYLMLKSPIIKADKKQSILDVIFNGKVDDLTLKFMKIITAKGREALLPEIVKSVVDYYNESKGISTAKLTTASKADAATIEAIKAKIQSKGGSVELDTKIDPSIIGGYILKMGDTIYDASVQRKIKDLRKELTNG